MGEVFTEIYDKSKWDENTSNTGSNIDFNKKYIPFLKELISTYDIQTIADLGCGDFDCGSLIYNDLNIIYQGYDIDKQTIDNLVHRQYTTSKFTFTRLDVFSNKEHIVSGDLCILKDVLQHWSLLKIYILLEYLTKERKFKYILIVNCDGQTEDNADIKDGKWRPLNSKYFPLKRYKSVIQGTYNGKEVSLIKI